MHRSAIAVPVLFPRAGQLLGCRRVALEPPEAVVVRFQVPTRLAFSGRSMVRIVETGEIELWMGGSCAEKETTTSITVAGLVHRVTTKDSRLVVSEVMAEIPALAAALED